MLSRFDEVKSGYPFVSRIIESRVEAPPGRWRPDPIDRAIEPETQSLPPWGGVKGPALDQAPRSFENHPVRRVIAQWKVKYGLTPSEVDVLDFLSQGMAPAVIARERSTSLGTVRTQLKSIFDKTGFRSQQAILVALLKGSDPGK